MLHVNEGNCRFLFDCEAKEIFQPKKFKETEEVKSQIVEESLDVLMKVNRYILSKDSGFAFVIPAAHNNQCHLYALRAAQILKNYRGKSEEEKCVKNEEINFFISRYFLVIP